MQSAVSTRHLSNSFTPTQKHSCQLTARMSWHACTNVQVVLDQHANPLQLCSSMSVSINLKQMSHNTVHQLPQHMHIACSKASANTGTSMANKRPVQTVLETHKSS